MILVKFSGMLCHVDWYIFAIQHVVTPLKACIFNIAPVIPSNLVTSLFHIEVKSHEHELGFPVFTSGQLS